MHNPGTVQPIWYTGIGQVFMCECESYPEIESTKAFSRKTNSKSHQASILHANCCLNLSVCNVHVKLGSSTE